MLNGQRSRAVILYFHPKVNDKIMSCTYLYSSFNDKVENLLYEERVMMQPHAGPNEKITWSGGEGDEFNFKLYAGLSSTGE